MDQSRYGVCHLCGDEGPLSFEHVPPQSAFNSNTVLLRKFDEAINEDYSLPQKQRGRQQQRGLGGYTLCGRCNSNTGAWYGNAYLDWAYQGMRHSHHTKVAPTLVFNFQIFPLRVIKQIVCMFFSVNGNRWRRAHPELERFVLDRDRRLLGPEVGIYAYFTHSRRSRTAGTVVRGDFMTGEIQNCSEVAFRPWGYVLAMNSRPPDARLVPISFFSTYRYNDWKELTLRFPLLDVESWIPGDYRSRDELAAVTRQ